MQFGVREICDVVFKAKTKGYLNKAEKLGEYKAGQPVLYIDSAKTSTLEGAASTVYATGGRGNSRLIAWEGEKTLTFTVEDALLSEIGFAILSGAHLFRYGQDDTESIAKVHQTTQAQITKVAKAAEEGGEVEYTYEIELPEAPDTNSPIFVMVMKNGSLTEMLTDLSVSDKKLTGVDAKYDGEIVFVDYYTTKTTKVTEMTIDAENFAGYYYVEASTLFRRQSDGKDLPAELIFPNVKIQSNFTFTMAATGDPSTFTFTMDAMPGYTISDPNHKVLCVMQIIDDETTDEDILSGDSIADAE